MNKGQYIAYFFLSGVAALFIVIGLGTYEWRVIESNGNKGMYGLKKYKQKIGGTTTTYDITDDTSAGKQYLEGADTALAMGIIALGCIIGNVVLVALLKLCQGWTGGRARLIAIIFSLAAAILVIIGTITYDAKLPSQIKDNTDYGFSFGLYITGGLLPFLIAVALIIQKEIF